MGKFVRIVCVVSIFIFCLSSCSKQSDGYYDDEQFQEGVEYGIEDTFLRMYDAVGLYNDEILWSGDIWDTDCFSLVLCDKRINDESYISYKLTLKNTTVGHCAEFGDVFFNIYAIGDTKGMILTRDNFIWYDDFFGSDESKTVEEFLDGNTAEGHIELIDDSDFQTLIIIIMTEGRLFTATYDYDYRK